MEISSDFVPQNLVHGLVLFLMLKPEKVAGTNWSYHIRWRTNYVLKNGKAHVWNFKISNRKAELTQNRKDFQLWKRRFQYHDLRITSGWNRERTLHLSGRKTDRRNVPCTPHRSYSGSGTLLPHHCTQRTVPARSTGPCSWGCKEPLQEQKN